MALIIKAITLPPKDAVGKPIALLRFGHLELSGGRKARVCDSCRAREREGKGHSPPGRITPEMR